jgi:pyridoxine 4-dehydrogenase
MRHHMTRFKDDEIMQYNFAIVDKIKTIAEKKGVTPAQLCLAWVSSLSPVMLPIPGSSYVVRSRVKLLADLFLRAGSRRVHWKTSKLVTLSCPLMS